MNIGVDVVDIERIKGLIERGAVGSAGAEFSASGKPLSECSLHGSDLAIASRFELSVFTERERGWIAGNPKRAAGCFAAKEAAAKALGTGIRGFSFVDIEVGHNDFGAPELFFYGEAARLLNFRTASLSISHSELVAVAFVVIS